MKWETYQEVAIYLLNEVAKEFGLEKVESKQNIIGLHSNTKWEVDGKGVKENDKLFVIVECKMYTTSKIKQNIVGALAFSIDDTGATGGIIVSPLGLQEGAAKVAKSKNIVPVILNENSSSTEYFMSFLDKIKVGLCGTLSLNGSLSNEVKHFEKKVQ